MKQQVHFFKYLMWLHVVLCNVCSFTLPHFFLNLETAKFSASPSPSHSLFHVRSLILPGLSLVSVLHSEAKTEGLGEEDVKPSTLPLKGDATLRLS